MVDVDFGGCGASGDGSSRRKMPEPLDSDCAEVVPLELYDSSRAKIAANLAWIFSKAYGIGNTKKSFPQLHLYPDLLLLKRNASSWADND